MDMFSNAPKGLGDIMKSVDGGFRMSAADEIKNHPGQLAVDVGAPMDKLNQCLSGVGNLIANELFKF